MTPSGAASLEQRLRALRERQAELAGTGRGAGAAMRACARDIAEVARQLGLDPEEAAAVAGQIDVRTSELGRAMAGEYRVLRGPAEPILAFCAVVIGGAMTGLGQPLAGVVLMAAAAASWVLHGALRVGRLRIDASGAPGFPGRLDRVEPSELVAVDFAYRHPPFATHLQRAAGETVDLRLRLTGGRSIRLARGPLWRTSPRREPVAYHQLERLLSAYARGAGMTVEQGDRGWTARRA